jgi:hypothetical protein
MPVMKDSTAQLAEQQANLQTLNFAFGMVYLSDMPAQGAGAAGEYAPDVPVEGSPIQVGPTIVYGTAPNAGDTGVPSTEIVPTNPEGPNPADAIDLSPVNVSAPVSNPDVVPDTTAANIQAVQDAGIPDYLSPKQDLHINPTDGRSPLTADPQDLLDGLQSGDFSILRQTRPNSVTVDFQNTIGEYWQNGQYVGDTQYGTVHFGQSGAHIVPANPNQW